MKKDIRKVWIGSVIGATVVSVALILFNLFQTAWTGWVVLTASLVIICAAVGGLVYSYCNPYWCRTEFWRYINKESNSDYACILTYKHAKSDLDQMMWLLKKIHPMFKHGLSDEIKVLYKVACDNLKAIEQITVLDLHREMQKMLHFMEDAHTATSAPFADRYLKIYHQRKREGWSMHSLNSMTREAVLNLMKPLRCYEDESGIDVDGFFRSLNYCRLYGVSTNPLVIVWKNKAGKTLTDTCYTSDFISEDEYMGLYALSGKSFVSYTTDEEKSLAVLTLSECNYNDEYKKTVKAMFTEIKNKGIKNVAVDLRDNGGGNGLVVDEFIRYLPVDTLNTGFSEKRYGFFTRKYGCVDEKNERRVDLQFDGNVFVITNSKTFSSATIFAEYIQDNHLGKIIGAYSSNAVNCYIDISTFILSKSGLCLIISTRECLRPDKTNPNRFVMPDIECDPDDALSVLYDEISNAAVDKQ